MLKRWNLNIPTNQTLSRTSKEHYTKPLSSQDNHFCGSLASFLQLPFKYLTIKLSKKFPVWVFEKKKREEEKKKKKACNFQYFFPYCIFYLVFPTSNYQTGFSSFLCSWRKISCHISLKTRTCSFPSLTFLLPQNSPVPVWIFNLQYNAIYFPQLCKK